MDTDASMSIFQLSLVQMGIHIKYPIVPRANGNSYQIFIIVTGCSDGCVMDVMYLWEKDHSVEIGPWRCYQVIGEASVVSTLSTMW